MSRATITGITEQKAKRFKLKASIGIDGLSGDGKSGLALMLGIMLAGGNPEKIYYTDTENMSALLYVGKTLSNGIVVPNESFLHAPLTKETGYSPFNYEYHRERAKKLGCEVHIMDSFTHAWLRQGGVLDEVNKEANKNIKVNKFNAWALPDIMDAKNLIFELIRDDKIHVISTIRVKEAYAQIQNEQGKTEIKSLGEKQMQSDGLTYEFDLVLSMIHPGMSNGRPPRVRVEKSRYDIFIKDTQVDITPEVMQALVDYLEDGADPSIIKDRMRTEMVTGLRERITNNQTLYSYFKNTYGKETKLSDLTLDQLRRLNAECIELEYPQTKGE